VHFLVWFPCASPTRNLGSKFLGHLGPQLHPCTRAQAQLGHVPPQARLVVEYITVPRCFGLGTQHVALNIRSEDDLEIGGARAHAGGANPSRRRRAGPVGTPTGTAYSVRVSEDVSVAIESCEALGPCLPIA
jgi:hypothetical protein